LKCLALSIDFETDELPSLEKVIEAAKPFSFVIKSISNHSGAREIYETRPGEVRLWDKCTLTAYFSLSQDIKALRKDLFRYDAKISDRVTVEFVDLEELLASDTEAEIDKLIGKKLQLRSKKFKSQNSDQFGSFKVYMDPGLAFGSGRHATTELCLEWLAENELWSQNVMDYGCGSGILGIAASVMGAKSTCVDYDDQALTATSQNAEFNNLTSRNLVVEHSSTFDFELHRGCFDVVVANILARPLMDLADQLQSLLAEDGTLVLSGILENQIDVVQDSYPELSFKNPVVMDGWVRLEARQD
jgi:ribosomal protein L11 methyltransferase